MTNDLRRRIAAGLLGLLLTGPAAALQIEGTHFDDELRLADVPLQLNGAGVRAVAWLKGYTAGLYLGQRARSAQAALAAPGPKRLQMRMLLEVEPQELVKAIDKGIRRNTPPAERASLAARQQQLSAALLGMRLLRVGDVLDLDYLPGRGTVLSLNGMPRGALLPGADFYAAVLRIFIGDVPVDDNLKAGLLGQRAPG